MNKPVYKIKGNALEKIFKKKKVVIGVVHLKPLPGSPNYNGEAIENIYQAAKEDSNHYLKGGVDGLIFENHGDIPFLKPEKIGYETVGIIAVIADRLRNETKMPIGINILANGAIPAIAVAKSSGASFVRINEWVNAYIANEGFVEGNAAEAARYRSWIRCEDVKLFTDVHVKHGAHAIVADRSITELARDNEFFGADVLIATGQRTGDSPTIEEVKEIKEASHLPLIIGSGASLDTELDIFKASDGVIVASSLKYDGVWWNPVDPNRVSKFMSLMEKIR